MRDGGQPQESAGPAPRDLAPDGADQARPTLEAIAAQMPGAIYRMHITDTGDYVFTYMSEGARKLFGLRPEQAVTDTGALFSAVVEEDLPAIEASTRRCNETLERWRCDFRVHTPDGTNWIRGEGRPHPAEDGRIVWDGFLTDVTEQKAAEARERRLLERISAILESTTDAVFTVDAEWRFTYMNGRAQKLLSRGSDVLGRNAWEAFPEAMGTILWEQYHRVRDESRSAEFDIYYAPLGKWLEVHARPHEGGVAVFFRDITERREAEKDLEAARNAAEAAGRAKSAFLAAMSHELRTPLNAITGFSEMIAHELLGPVGVAEYREYARDIQSSSKHLLQVVSDVLDLARLEAGAGKLDEDIVDVVEVLNEALETIAPGAGEKRLALARDVPPECPNLRGDARAVKQILRHLLSNAVKFTEAGAVETVVRCDAEGLTVSVRDTGIGIGAAEQKLLCEPFQQADSSLTRRYQGAGIGLALTKRLVELHGGHLEIRSAPNAGTTVDVRFPAWRTVGEHAALRSAGPPA